MFRVNQMSPLPFADQKAAPDLYRLLVNHSLDLIIAYTPDGKVAYVGPSVEEVLGYGQDEFFGMDPYDLIHADDRQTVRENYHEPAATGRRVFTRPYRMRKKGCDFAYLETLVQPVMDADDRVLLLVTSSRDVTDRVRTERKLHAALQELQFEKTAMDMHAIVSVVDTEGRITHVNDKFCHVAQYRRRELLGKCHSVLNSGYHPKEFFDGMLETIAQGRIWQGEIRNRRKDGSFFWVNTTIVPFLDAGGAPYKYVSVRTDVTHIRQAKEALERSNEDLERLVAKRTRDLGRAKESLKADMLERARAEEKLRERYSEVQALNRRLQETQHQLLQSEKLASIGQLAAGVAHEINNPIGYVSSNLGTLETYFKAVLRVLDAYAAAEGAICDPEALHAVRAVKKKDDLDYLREDLSALIGESREGIGRVRKIVQDLRDFSRLDDSEEWVRANLHGGLDSTLNIVANEVKYKAEVVKEYGDLPEIECLPSQLNQVFLNLIVNAAQAIEGRGVITIRTGADGAQAWVEIADTGSGIPPENLKRIFDPFFTTKPVGQGTGLGLSVSYGIVQKHRGNITVASEPGRGTTFRIQLPLRQPPADSAGE